MFDSDRSGNPDLWIKDLATGKLSQITAHPAPDWGGRFSPDGEEIVSIPFAPEAETFG